ncbi:MAG TPA: tetratricopeptide repeat protein [Chthoniobacterales bacterium]|nr:tetratricopeptide repeat protein [Chthoniobacterales bacterium]
MSGFFEEIKRRKVYRVAVAYAVVAWLVIQAASIVFPAWELPAWALRLTILLLLIGFPIALILAWALEVTPEGIRATPSIPMAPRRRRNIVALVAIGVIVSAAAGFFLLPRASARKIDKSIAVLPFENFSDDKENAYFADGIQDDILTNLSKIGDLKVISRTSVMPYRGKEKNVKEIGKALGVSAILEGSVRKSGNRVRVNVQLINAENDEHVWSEIYDRDLTDMFAIQTDLAKKIADELHAKLSPTEKAQMTRKPTENGEAYLAFVQAHNLQREREELPKLKQAEPLFDRALQLDPNFALAAASYSQLQSWIYHSFEPTAERRNQARTLAERALRLQPDLAEAHLALGFAFYYGERDYDRALAEFAIAQKGLPNEAEAYLAIGAIQRRQGKWDESNANLEKAASLSPNETWPLQNLALNYQMQRKWELANKTVDRGLKVAPDSFALWSIKAQLEISEKGTYEIAERGAKMVATKPMDEQTRLHFNIGIAQVRLLQRRYAEVVQLTDSMRDELLGNDVEQLMGKYGTSGLAKKMLGDEAGAREALLKVKGYAEQFVAAAPNEAKRRTRLAECLAWLGEKEAAIAEAKRAIELLPESVDAFDGPVCTQTLAEVYMIVGDYDQALAIVDGLLSRPSDATVAKLKVNPLWDPIRNDPRFIALLKKHGG